MTNLVITHRDYVARRCKPNPPDPLAPPDPFAPFALLDPLDPDAPLGAKKSVLVLVLDLLPGTKERTKDEDDDEHERVDSSSDSGGIAFQALVQGCAISPEAIQFYEETC
jgi:hypothetical protein